MKIKAVSRAEVARSALGVGLLCLALVSSPARAEAGLEHLPSAPRDPESAAGGAQVQEKVQEALLQLPPDLRMAVILYDIEGQPYRDIAAVLGIPEGTVKSRIHRARNALRELLREFVRARILGDEP